MVACRLHLDTHHMGIHTHYHNRTKHSELFVEIKSLSEKPYLADFAFLPLSEIKDIFCSVETAWESGLGSRTRRNWTHAIR